LEELVSWNTCRAASAIFSLFLVLAPITDAKAADAENGERIARSTCAACHVIEVPMTRREVADAPPFTAIARKFDFDPDMLAFHLLEPHPKMNFALTRRQADDVAAYMSTLRR